MSREDSHQRREVTSWKEIAEFLEVSIRTAQRYEAEMSLPVRRLGGDKGRAVAYLDDLAAWKAKSLRLKRWWQEPRFLGWYSACCSVAVIVLGAYAAWHLFNAIAVGQPCNAQWRGATLVATDAEGREVWRRAFTPELHYGTGWVRVGDLDRDGRVETVVPLVPGNGELKDSYASSLVCLSSKGHELWSIEPKRVVSDHSTRFTGVYVLRSYKVFPSPEKDVTFWTVSSFAHHLRYPSVLIVADSKGNTRGEYWHSGHLDHVATADLDGDGVEEILAAGMTLGSQQAVVRVFDPRNVGGADTLPSAHTNQILGFSRGTERATLFFPRTRLNRQIAEFNWAYHINVDRRDASDGSWEVFVRESIDDTAGYLVYILRPDLSLASIVPSVSFLEGYLNRSFKDPSSKPFGSGDLEELRRAYRIQRTR